MLDALFKDARRDAQAPVSRDLEARVVMQAAQVQAAITRAPRRVWQRCWAELGGWPTATGLVTATAAGLWLGGAEPQTLDTVWTGIGLSTVSLDSYFPDYDTLFEEI
jgi:hypothetical protein